MGNSINYSYEQLKTFCTDAFLKFGFKQEEADIIVDVLLTSDLYGIESHGMQRLVRYHKGIEKGLIKIGAKPEIVFETPMSAVIEGNDGMGQLLGHKAMTIAIEKAKQVGMAIVTVRNSTVKGEYLAWYSENLTLINCKIIGTQPFCYCKNLTLVNCEMLDTDLSFEKSEVNASITTPVISIKNPTSGRITVPAVDELILTDENAKAEIIIGNT